MLRKLRMNSKLPVTLIVVPLSNLINITEEDIALTLVTKSQIAVY